MSDITLNRLSLEELIQVLENDNQEIDLIIKNINSAIRKLDAKSWKSYEKEKMDHDLLPYLNQIENKVYPFLEECVTLLKNANQKYGEKEEAWKEKIKMVDDSISIEVL